jgi:hypothetical protein
MNVSARSNRLELTMATIPNESFLVISDELEQTMNTNSIPNESVYDSISDLTSFKSSHGLYFCRHIWMAPQTLNFGYSISKQSHSVFIDSRFSLKLNVLLEQLFV